MTTPSHTAHTQQPAPGWCTLRFGDVVRNVDEAVRDLLTCDLERFVGLEHIDPESLRIKRWGLIADGTSFTRKFTAGQVLFGKRRAYQRKVAVADFDGLCSSDILVFEPADDRLLPELLPFIVQTEGFFQHALGTSAGSLSPRTRWRDLAAYEFALPSLDEQRRIAEILWAAEEMVERWVLVVADLEQLRRALQESYFAKTGRDGWKNAKLGDLFEVELGKAISPDVRQGLSPKAYLRNANVYWRRFDLSDVKKMDFSETELERYSLRGGDLLVCEARAVGRSAIWNNEIAECYYQNALHRLRSIKGDLKPELMLEFLAFASAKGLLIPLVGEMTIPHLPAVKLRELLVPVPPVETQAEMVESFNGVEQGILRAEQNLNASRKLFEALREHLIGG